MSFKFTTDVEQVTGLAASRVVEIAAETQAALRATVLKMFREGIDPKTGAKIMSGIVGQTERQALQSAQFYQGLVKKGLKAQRVQKLYDRFVRKQLKRRSLNIARTETMTILNGGQQMAWDQGLKRGELDRSALVKKWLVSPNPCPRVCEPMTGAVVEIDESFRIPGPPAHPSCTCSQALVRRKRQS